MSAPQAICSASVVSTFECAARNGAVFKRAAGRSARCLSAPQASVSVVLSAPQTAPQAAPRRPLRKCFQKVSTVDVVDCKCRNKSGAAVWFYDLNTSKHVTSCPHDFCDASLTSKTVSVGLERQFSLTFGYHRLML